MIKIAKPALSLLTLVCLFFAFSGNASGNSLTPEQITLIKNNCVSAKVTLNQLHSSDALLRVNSGQIYESLATKLMEKFNDRLASNKRDSTNMANITKGFKASLDSFRMDYISYEEQITKALSVDCVKQPESFYAATESARTKRLLLYTDVAKLNQKIEEYKIAITDLKNVYKASDGGSGN